MSIVSDSTAIIMLAAGSSSRMGMNLPKQFVRIAGKPVMRHGYEALRRVMPQALMVIVAPYEHLDLVKAMFADDPMVRVVSGGDSRQASTYKGLQALKSDPPQHVLIHDAARPFLDGRIIEDVLEALSDHDAVDVAIPTADTIVVEREGLIESIPERRHLLRGQTPQAFRYQALLQCYQELTESELSRFTDDCGIFLACRPKSRIRVVKGSDENIKITTGIDLILADELFRLKQEQGNHAEPGFNLDGKNALIFGGTKGIGKAVSEVLCGSGARVIARSRENGCDITEAEQVQQAILDAEHELGRIDLVVNAVGLLQKGSLCDQDTASITTQINVNLLGAIHVARYAHAALKKTQGVLLNFSSSSYTRGRSDYAIYSSTKAAIVNLSQGLSEEWADDGIKVNVLVPGRTDTSMRRQNFQGEKQSTLMSPYAVALVAGKVLSSNVTGQVIRC